MVSGQGGGIADRVQGNLSEAVTVGRDRNKTRE